MTLCIAAHANELLERQIVICYDRQVGDDLSTSEMTVKRVAPFVDRMVALWAGTLDHIEDLLEVYRERLSARTLLLTDFKEELYVGFKEFEELLKRRGVKRTDTQLIVAGFVEGVPKIVLVSREGVSVIPHCCAIGSGGYHAETILRWRGVVPQMPLNMAIYSVFEAKKFGELSPYVGKTTIMEILGIKDGRLTISAVCRMDRMQEYFKRFGPQPIGDITLEGPVLQECSTRDPSDPQPLPE